MNSEWRRRTQIFLIVLLLATGVRLYIIYRSRNEPVNDARTAAESKPISADAYVTPRKVHAYDLRSARFLAGKQVWVQAGNQMLYFPYEGGRRRVDFNHPVGLLPPLAKLDIKDVVLATDPFRQRKVMAVFTQSGESTPRATSVGSVSGDNYNLFIDNAFLLDDPRELYKHWPAEVWQAIEQHQVKRGMNELQTAFSLGGGVPRSSGDYGNRTMEYSFGDKKTTVSFSSDRATDIQEGK